MTMQTSHSLIDNLMPSDGRPTEVSRLLGDRADGTFIYIRVRGSDLLTLEAQFYGRDLGRAFLYGKQDVPGHDVYYRTDVLERREFEIRRVAGNVRGGELHTKRQVNFRRSLPKSFKSVSPDPPRDWKTVPDKYSKHKFLMKVAQERADDLRKMGFTDEQVDLAARQGTIAPLILRDENGNPLRDKDGFIRKIPFHVHHCVPLQCGGANAVGNFALVDDLVHLRFFHRGDDPVVSNLSEGAHATVAITMPRAGEEIVSLFLNVDKVAEKRSV